MVIVAVFVVGCFAGTIATAFVVASSKVSNPDRGPRQSLIPRATR